MMHRPWKPSAVLMQQGSMNGSRSLGGSTDHGGNVRVEQTHQWERRHSHIPIGKRCIEQRSQTMRRRDATMAESSMPWQKLRQRTGKDVT
jgi:hypothetical protein